MLLGIPKYVIDEKYDDIVEFSGIKRAIDKPVKDYSSGMRSRLGFSIAAVLKPDIFIIDEGLSTGDLAFRQKATERIQEMMDQAKAVVIVTHSMRFVEQVCTRAIWIDQGKIRADGDAEKIVAKYRKEMGTNKKRGRKKRRTKKNKNKRSKKQNEKKIVKKKSKEIEKKKKRGHKKRRTKKSNNKGTNNHSRAKVK